MVRTLLALAALGLFAGCASGPSRMEAAIAEHKQAQARCPTAPQAAFAQCMAMADRTILRPEIPEPDLLEVITTTRLALAGRVDRGEMRPEESEAEMARVRSQVIAEFERRRLTRRSVAAQEAPVICTRTGNMTTCF